MRDVAKKKKCVCVWPTYWNLCSGINHALHPEDVCETVWKSKAPSLSLFIESSTVVVFESSLSELVVFTILRAGADGSRYEACVTKGILRILLQKNPETFPVKFSATTLETLNLKAHKSTPSELQTACDTFLFSPLPEANAQKCVSVRTFTKFEG